MCRWNARIYFLLLLTQVDFFGSTFYFLESRKFQNNYYFLQSRILSKCLYFLQSNKVIYFWNTAYKLNKKAVIEFKPLSSPVHVKNGLSCNLKMWKMILDWDQNPTQISPKIWTLLPYFHIPYFISWILSLQHSVAMWLSIIHQVKSILLTFRCSLKSLQFLETYILLANVHYWDLVITTNIMRISLLLRRNKRSGLTLYMSLYSSTLSCRHIRQNDILHASPTSSVVSMLTCSVTIIISSSSSSSSSSSHDTYCIVELADLKHTKPVRFQQAC